MIWPAFFHSTRAPNAFLMFQGLKDRLQLGQIQLQPSPQTAPLDLSAVRDQRPQDPVPDGLRRSVHGGMQAQGEYKRKERGVKVIVERAGQVGGSMELFDHSLPWERPL